MAYRLDTNTIRLWQTKLGLSYPQTRVRVRMLPAAAHRHSSATTYKEHFPHCIDTFNDSGARCPISIVCNQQCGESPLSTT